MWFCGLFVFYMVGQHKRRKKSSRNYLLFQCSNALCSLLSMDGCAGPGRAIVTALAL